MRRVSYSCCKDCGTDKIIPTHKDNELTEILCKDCLSSRAQLQSIKEDKLSFTALLTKIRKETERRVQSEIRGQAPAYGWLSRYKGICGTINANYWKEQLQQSK